MPTLEFENKLIDIDPFTVFGLFNKSSMREANRIKIITDIKEIFVIKTAVPDSFDSIPVLNNQNATFYSKTGMNPKMLQYIMGHGNISVTLNTYTHVKYDDALAELKRVGVV